MCFESAGRFVTTGIVGLDPRAWLYNTGRNSPIGITPTTGNADDVMTLGRRTQIGLELFVYRVAPRKR